MASKKEQYETISVRTSASLWSGRDKKVEKLVAQGWEVVSTAPWGMGGVKQTVLRRPNPKYKG